MRKPQLPRNPLRNRGRYQPRHDEDHECECNHDEPHTIDLLDVMATAITDAMFAYEEDIGLNPDLYPILMVNSYFVTSEEQAITRGAKPGDFTKRMRLGISPIINGRSLHWVNIKKAILRCQDLYPFIHRKSLYKRARKAYMQREPGHVLVLYFFYTPDNECVQSYVGNVWSLQARRSMQSV